MFQLRKLSYLIMVVALITFLSACTQGTSTKESSGNGKNLNLATATTGGAYYPIGNSLASIWGQNLDGVRVSAQATQGTPNNLELLKRGDVDLAIGQNGVIFEAYQGEGIYDEAHTHLRSITNLYPNVIQFIVNNDGEIKNIADLEGKKFIPGSVGSAADVNSKQVFEPYGLSYDNGGNVKADYVGFNEASDALKNRQTDGIMISGGLPTPAVVDLSNSMDISVLEIEKSKREEVIEKYPFYIESVLPGGTYPGIDKDIETLGIANILVVHEDVDADMVYELTKAIFEDIEKVQKSHNAIAELDLQNALDGLTAPLHEGAKRYYEEKGLDVSKVE